MQNQQEQNNEQLNVSNAGGGAKTIKKPSKAFKAIIAIVIAMMVVASFFAGFFTYKAIQGEKANSISWLIGQIDKHYMVYDEQTGEVRKFTTKDYAEAIKNGLLDKYSDYYTAEEYSDVISTKQGNTFGIGVSFLSGDDAQPVIFKLKGNSPAKKSGLKVGDLLVAGQIDGQKTTFENYNQMLSFLDARQNEQEFILYVTRDGEFENKAFTLKKQVFVTSYAEYVDSQKVGEFTSDEGQSTLSLNVVDGGNPALDSLTAIIKLDQFEGNAAGQMADALELMKTRGRTKLILDLRDNGGGYMDVLEKICSRLTYGQSEKTLIARALYKDNSTDDFYTLGDYFNREITSVVAIANEHTASASECLLGAMLYYGRGIDQNKLIVVNDGLANQACAKTYGKGIMQTTYYNYTGGDAVKLTTAYIYQPDKQTCIHGVGLIATAENSFSDDALALNRAIQLVG